MATYISRQSGNYTATSTWYTADTGTSSQQVSGTNTTTSTTTYSYSSTFTGTNTKVADGVLLFLFRTSTTGTFSVALSEDNGTTATREVTVNCSDIPAYPTWMFFKFGSTLTLDGGTDYRVGIKTSTNATVTVYRDGTAGNWNRLIRITDAAATLTTGDITYTIGEWTGGGSFSSFTVTINTTSGTTPSATTNMGNLEVGSKGLLAFSTAASSTFQIQLQGNLRVYADGEFNMGISSDKIPSTSTATLFFNSGSGGQYGATVLNGAIFRAYGQRPTYFRTKLNADASASATALTTTDSTGWVNGDVIGIGSSNRSTTSGESRTVSSTSGTTLNITAGLTNIHHGSNADRKTDIILITRNAKIRGNTTTNTTYIYALDQALLELDGVQMFNFGTNTSGSATVPWTTPGKRGIEVESSSSSLAKSLYYCSLQDFTNVAAMIHLGSNTTNFSNITLNSCVAYSMYYSGVFNTNAPTAASSFTMTDCSFMNSTFQGAVTGTNTTISGSRWSGITNGPALSFDSAGLTNGATPTTISISNCEFTANSTGGFTFNNNIRGVTFSNCIFWRNTGSPPVTSLAEFIVFDNCKFLDNSTSNFSINAICHLIFKNCTFDTFSGFTTANGLLISTSANVEANFYNCTFGTNLGHTSGDISWSSTTTSLTSRLNFVNCTLASATKYNSDLTGPNFASYITHTNEGGVANVHSTRYNYGRIECDSTIFRTSLPSEALYPINVPTSGGLKLESSRKLVPVASGNTVTVSVYVRKSVIGDGAAYNGNQPRLMLRQNNKLGITSDTVIDTSTASGDGAWEELTGTTAAASADGIFEFYIDCTGSAGQVNIDDWSVT